MTCSPKPPRTNEEVSLLPYRRRGTWRTGRPITDPPKPPRFRYATLFLTPEDEAALHAAIVEAHPGTVLLEPTASLAVKARREHARTADAGPKVLLWDPVVQPVLRNPVNGRVVKWQRGSCTEDGVLDAGMWTVAMRDSTTPEMQTFINDLWRAMLRFTSNYLVRWVEGTGVEQRMPSYRIGPDALKAATEGRITLDSGGFGPLHPPSQDKARGAAL